MDCINSIKTIQAWPVAVKSRRRGAPASDGFSNSSRKSISQSQNIYTRRRSRVLIVAVANTELRGFKYSGVGTPHEPSSPEGRFLSAILQNHRCLFSFAVTEQLHELASKRDDAAAQKIQNEGCMESILHNRIEEMKEKERQNGVEDVIYMSIVHKFSKVRVPMVQKLSDSIIDNRLAIWPSKCKELESIHSLEVLELTREHVARVLRMRGKSFLVDSGSTTTKIDRLDLGRTYAASVMYGYFLKSACFRRQMDMSLLLTQDDFLPQHTSSCSVSDSYLNRFRSIVTLDQSTETQILERTCDARYQNLRSYVMGFDAQSLQRCAKLKSQEAVNVIEKHTWALFGDDNMSGPDSDKEMVITFPSLERLLLEAVAFGTFLWDVEKSVDSTYTLRKN